MGQIAALGIFHCPNCGFMLSQDWNGDAWDFPGSFAEYGLYHF